MPSSGLDKGLLHEPRRHVSPKMNDLKTRVSTQVRRCLYCYRMSRTLKTGDRSQVEQHFISKCVFDFAGISVNGLALPLLVPTLKIHCVRRGRILVLVCERQVVKRTSTDLPTSWNSGASVACIGTFFPRSTLRQ